MQKYLLYVNMAYLWKKFLNIMLKTYNFNNQQIISFIVFLLTKKWILH